MKILHVLLKLVLLFGILLFVTREIQIDVIKDNKQKALQVKHLKDYFKVRYEDAVEITEAVSIVSAATKVPPSLLYAMIEQESSFKIQAINKKSKASCLMQVHKSSGYKLLESTPETCLITATSILLSFEKKFGNFDKAIKAFYCGNNITRKSCKKYKDSVRYKQLNYERWV